MDFCYHIQAYHIMDKDFDIVNATLHEFHLHKNSILDAGYVVERPTNQLITGTRLCLSLALIWYVPSYRT